MKFRMDINKIKEINWREFFKRNKYGAISILILAAYAGMVLWTVSFLAFEIRSAFQIEENTAGQVTTFDAEGYNKIAERFNLE